MPPRCSGRPRSSSPTSRREPSLWRAVARASEQAFGMDGFRDALEHVIELTPEGRSRAQLYSELAIRGANPATWTDPPAARRSRRGSGMRSSWAGPTRPCGPDADRPHEPRSRGDRRRGQGDARDRRSAMGWTRCSVPRIGISRTAPPLPVTSRRRAGGRITSARSRPSSPTAANGRCGTCTPPWSTSDWDGSRRRAASPRSTTRWQPACHRTTMSMPSGPRCSRGPSWAAGRRRADWRPGSRPRRSRTPTPCAT